MFFPNKDGIDHDLSPDAIILGTPKLDYNNIKLPFGSYVNLYDGTDNTMNSRTVGAITSRASNEHGSYYFMSLRIGRRLNSSQWTELPITDEVIDRVDNMAKKELQQPNTTTDGIVFEWEPGVPIDSDIIVIKNNENEVSNDEECITNINEIPEVNENSSSSVNIEKNNQEYDNNMSETNAHIEDNLDKLTKLWFKVNEYDRCVANKMINSKQCTIVWYVDDVKVSHVDETVVSDIITYIKKNLGTSQ